MDHGLDVPGWYKFQCWLMSYRLTRGLLYQYHRLKKRLYKLKEIAQVKSQLNNIRNFEKLVYSQNGEDGIVAEIFRRIGTTDRVFVEFGAQDGIQCCTRNLLENAAWSGTWIECSAKHVGNAKKIFKEFPVNVIEQFLTAENIVSVFKDARVPHEFDLMAIDVDGNEFWLWQALIEQYRPRVLIVEYNATFGPTAAWKIPYDPQHRYAGTAYTGASLKALAELGSHYGYALVGCNSTGVNAFFIREDTATSAFDDLDKPVSRHYVAPHFDWWFGHPVKKID